eukprot:GCRY01008257.1.p3 GENE.GCRY01008257.1~~GCRY01008257.1.p3  ORF type:complete len:109 (-),score=20.54 GCRY01008257.1:116-442(-)
MGILRLVVSVAVAVAVCVGVVVVVCMCVVPVEQGGVMGVGGQRLLLPTVRGREEICPTLVAFECMTLTIGMVQGKGRGRRRAFGGVGVVMGAEALMLLRDSTKSAEVR